jgi:sodium transport system permease protein
MRHIGIVWGKELLDTVRDRRAVILMIVVPLVLMPVLLWGPNALRTATEQQTEQHAQKISVIRPEEAPDLVEQIDRSRVLTVVAVEDPQKALKEGEIAAVLVLPSDFSQSLATEAGSIDVIIRYDVSSSDSRTAQEKLGTLLLAYRDQVVRGRLQQRGLSPQLLEPFRVREENVAPPERVSGFALSFLLPLFLVLWAAIGGSQTAIDISAGEKERGTLESLLVTPPRRSSLVVGKFLTVTTVTLIATTLSLVGLVVSLLLGKQLFASNPLFERLDFSLRLDILGLIFGVVALLAAMMSALTFTLYSWTRNFKEAQTYASYISFIVVIPGFLVLFMEPPTSLESFLIPVYNSTIALKELLLGDVKWDHLGVTLLSSTVYAILSLMIAVRVFQNERVLFRQ